MMDGSTEGDVSLVYPLKATPVVAAIVVKVVVAAVITLNCWMQHWVSNKSIEQASVT